MGRAWAEEGEVGSRNETRGREAGVEGEEEGGKGAAGAETRGVTEGAGAAEGGGGTGAAESGTESAEAEGGEEGVERRVKSGSGEGRAVSVTAWAHFPRTGDGKGHPGSEGYGRGRGACGNRSSPHWPGDTRDRRR